MPTITQLPPAETVSASDILPISQDGSVHAVTVGSLLAQTQPAIIIGPPSLLGRYSIGSGGPDSIAIGPGLALNDGTLTATTFDLGTLPTQASLVAGDQIVVMNEGTSQLVALEQIREVFTAGTNVTIDANGIISASASTGIGGYSLTSLSSVSTIGPADLVGISQQGADHTITYTNLLDGVTIDEAQPAVSASDGDTFWVAQASNIMLRQTIGALWPWMSAKLASWTRPAIEVSQNITLTSTSHNNAVLICSGPLAISAVASNLSNGFSCEVINLSSGNVTLSSDVVTSTGANSLSPLQGGTIYCVAYSGGTVIYASIHIGASATAAPGVVTGLAAATVNASAVTINWSAPASGGAISAYSIQYRVTGTTTWLAAGQTAGLQDFTITGLQASTSYDFAVSATNAIGNGPLSAPLTVVTASSGSLPGSPTSLSATSSTTSGLTWSWAAPAGYIGTLTYTVQYRVTGQTTWTSAVSGLSSTTFTITGLTANTSYDVQVIASSANGSGPPSTTVAAETAQAAGLVNSITWQLAPTGTFTHGAGAIGVNAHVSPATAAIQFGFSTSSTTPPTSWVAAAYVNSDLWGQYVPTPATAGSWYGWAEGTDGSCPTVYPTPFTVT